MNIIYSKQATKFIASQNKAIKSRIKKSIEGLTKIPPKGDIKQLQNYTIKTYRLRVGKYRIIYRYDTVLNEQRILFISDIDSRGDIYK
ncbi:MAG: type II toxin-antitoxin system RelE/ParE family toxin [Defluviitaleaceae bacterium]|nr:type II toxin-antitoxin system RelE/ParE family toxin [Defluviitaleaceae bacterium]